MAISIAYRRLFEIQILHQYYQDWISGDFTLAPTPATRRMLTNYQLLARTTPNGLIVLAKIDDAGRLAVPIPLSDGFKLVFKLQLRTPHFFNFTNLPLEKPAVSFLNSGNKAGYYFTNLHDNEHSTTNPDYDLKLLSRQTAQPISTEDEVVYFPRIGGIRLPAEDDEFTLNLNGFDGTALPSITVSEPDDFRDHDADLSAVPPGFYTIDLNGDAATEQRIYLDDDAFSRSPFGLIEIFHNGDVPANYRFATGAGDDEVDPQIYHLWFANRLATWRYIFPVGTPTNLDIEHTPSNDTFNDQTTPEAVFYDSPNPLPLTEAYQEVLLDQQGNDVLPLPNPDGKIVLPQLTGGTITGFQAEVYL